MKVSYKWLQEYLEIPVSPEELADKVSRTGIEVEDVSYPNEGLKNIVVGHVIATKPHPDSDHLTICQVEVGEPEPIQIICGAPNVATGQYVIAALAGARIKDNQKIKKGKIRGEVSNGMLCALEEIGFSESVSPQKYEDGIFVFPEALPVGTDVYPYLGMDEAILDFDITPNRGDVMSMRGVAHEVSAIYETPVKFPTYNLQESDTQISDRLKVSLAENSDVLAYENRIVENVTIKPSPLWLQIHLWNAGVRPINNVVDVTNYILMTFGQPMHAFDYDKLKTKELLVRKAAKDETVVTLDGVERKLVTDDIVIADGQVPVAVAGVMGGQSTEISGSTTTVILEAAIFDPVHIRKTAQRLNLRSEASARFERGINPSDVQNALDAAASLIAELGEGTTLKTPLITKAPNDEPTKITITTKRINHILGTDLTGDQISNIFDRLGFSTQQVADDLNVVIPPRRGDIAIEADLIEEVARLYGYDNLPVTLPTGGMTVGALTATQQFKRQTRHLMESLGLTQAISYALTTEEKAVRFQLSESIPTRLDFPMTEDHSYLRLNLLSGLLDDVAYNQARQQQDIAYYEQGRVFPRTDNQNMRPAEREHLAGVITGEWQVANWQGKKVKTDFYRLKGILSAYFTDCDFAEPITFKPSAAHEEMHPGRTADIYLGDELVGMIGQIHPGLAKTLKISETYGFELDLTLLEAATKQTIIYNPISKFPQVTRDMALLMDDNITHQQIMDVINKTHGAYLVDVSLFDVFSGEKLGLHKKSMAYTLTYEDKTATLTDDVVNHDFEKIKKALTDELNISVR